MLAAWPGAGECDRSALSWLSVLLLFLLIVTYVPWISLLLPDALFGTAIVR